MNAVDIAGFDGLFEELLARLAATTTKHWHGYGHGPGGGSAGFVAGAGIIKSEYSGGGGPTMTTTTAMPSVAPGGVGAALETFVRSFACVFYLFFFAFKKSFIIFFENF